jgi:hypothetical protein
VTSSPFLYHFTLGFVPDAFIVKATVSPALAVISLSRSDLRVGLTF